jgi:hypothetical protein
MLHSSLRRSFLVLALGLSLGSQSASAAPISWGGFLAEQGRSASRFLEAVLTKFPRTTKHGCSINPDGQPLCAPKLGCSIDPDGQLRCAPGVPSKLGCTIDPNGHTACTP